MSLITKTMVINTEKEELLSGKELFPMKTNQGELLLSRFDYEKIMGSMAGLKRRWDCLMKAQKVKEYFGSGYIVVGGCLIWSKDMKSQFGYWFNPPLELHAWWQPYITPNQKIKPSIIDFALPGIIEKGMNTSDELGPFITGRDPFVLAGTAPDWVIYKGITEVVFKNNNFMRKEK